MFSRRHLIIYGLLGLAVLIQATVTPIRLLAEEKQDRPFSLAAIPNFFVDDDMGIGYGLQGAMYARPDAYAPYFYKFHANFWNTTKGPMRTYLFFDSPYLIPSYRLSVDLRYNDDSTSPFSGIGNWSSLETETYQRRRLNLATDLQRTIWQPPEGEKNVHHKLQALLGLGIFNTDINLDQSPSLQKMTPVGAEGGWTNYLKLGIVHDTRDNESVPTQGYWLDLLAEASNSILGSDYNYLRLTSTLRVYFPLLSKRLIYAGRVMGETLVGDPPFYELSYFANSAQWKEEALGGSKSLRGIPLNRFIGKTKFFSNQELRWLIVDFRFLNQDFTLAANLFLDFGGVWHDEAETNSRESTATNTLKISRGGGMRLIWNKNFIVAGDIGNSKETPMAVYIGIGYLY